MKQSSWTILSNEPIAWRTYRMVLQGDTSDIRPGQFVEIQLPNYYLRRPISVCDIDADRLTLIYKTVGEGTAAMAAMPAGTELDILSCLGNGYDLTKAGDEVLLVGGGVGVPPLLYAAKCLLSQGKQVRVVMGFGSSREVFAEEDFRRLGCEVSVCTMDGSYGTKGVVTDLISQEATFYYACGPIPMLRALVRELGKNGQLSMEERMGCGVGICVGCSIETRSGAKRVCKEGPVFDAGDIIWK
ncbi:MAG: dihydroorotate dehydrogenase electron transfer subunit [Paludibacteraceae bacterium]|nr:dihydroorotate dehydrogenase electron transfer subunit [Paludibacteraceae bacterium]